MKYGRVEGTDGPPKSFLSEPNEREAKQQNDDEERLRLPAWRSRSSSLSLPITKTYFLFFFLLLLFSPCSSVPSLRRWSPLASSESACAWACFCGWIVPYLFFSFLLLPFVFCLGILFTKTEQPTFLLFFSFLPPLLSSPVPFGSVLLGLGFPDRSTHTHDFIFSLSHSLSRSLFCTSTSTSMEKKIRRWKKRSKVKA